MKAAKLSIGQKVNVSYSHPEVQGGAIQSATGTVADHFGDGVFIILSKPIQAFDNEAEERDENVYGHLSHRSEYQLSSFDYYDNEENIATVTPIK